MDLSIIVPLYNVEEFVVRCLNSILHQKNTIRLQYEVIVINDGSTDNSLQLVQEIAKVFPNVKILSQVNQGQSVARNRGLSISCGEYVWFIDSDDWISNDAFDVLFSFLTNIADKPDLVIFRAGTLERQKLVAYQSPFNNENVCFSGKEILQKRIWPVNVHTFLLKRSFLLDNSLRFYPGIFHEDNEFTPKMLYLASKVYLLNDVLYFVTRNPHSTTRTSNSKKAYDLLIASESLANFCSTQVVESSTQKIFHQFISLSINSALWEMKDKSEREKQTFNQYVRKKKILFTHLLLSGIPKYMIECLLFNCTPNYLKAYNQLIKLKNIFS